MGESAFDAMTKVYIARYPSAQPNTRWHARHLPEFLADSQPYARTPELAELARLGRALNEAFDAVDAPAVSFADLAALAPQNFGKAVFDIHPSTRRLRVTTNVTGLWSSLKCDEMPPRPRRLAVPQEILVWRQDGSPRFRLLGNEEAMAIDAAAEGGPFAVICEKIAAMDDPANAGLRATGYLRGWIEAQAVSRIRLAAAAAEK